MPSSNEGRVAFRGIPPEVHRRMKVEAARRDVGLGDLIRQVLEDWLKKNEGKSR